MNWHNRKVLITGADGFIGLQLVEAPDDNGADVTALSRYDSFGECGDKALRTSLTGMRRQPRNHNKSE